MATGVVVREAVRNPAAARTRPGREHRRNREEDFIVIVQGKNNKWNSGRSASGRPWRERPFRNFS
jgi:hypothetical protein